MQGKNIQTPHMTETGIQPPALEVRGKHSNLQAIVPYILLVSF